MLRTALIIACLALAAAAAPASADPEITPETIDFGEVEVGTFAAEEFSLANDLENAVGWLTVGPFKRPPFSLDGPKQAQRRILKPGEEGTRRVTFFPSAIGTYAWSVPFRIWERKAGEGQLDEERVVRIEGKAVGSGIEVTTSPEQPLPSYDFGDVVIGSTVSMEVTLTNRTEAPVVIDSVRLQKKRSRYTIEDRDAPNEKLKNRLLNPGESLIVRVEYAPTADAPAYDKLVIKSDAFPVLGGKSRFQLFLSGLPVDKVGLSDRKLNFGKVDKGGFVEESLVLTNGTNGPIPVKLKLANKSDPAFAPATLGKVTLAGGEAREIEIGFAPTRKGKTETTLLIRSKEGFVDGKRRVVLEANVQKPAPGEPLTLDVDGEPEPIGSFSGTWLEFSRDEVEMILQALRPEGTNVLLIDVAFDGQPQVGVAYEIPERKGERRRQILYDEPTEATFEMAVGGGTVVFDKIKDDGDARRAVGRYEGLAVDRFGGVREIEGTFDVTLPYEVP